MNRPTTPSPLRPPRPSLAAFGLAAALLLAACGTDDGDDPAASAIRSTAAPTTTTAAPAATSTTSAEVVYTSQDQLGWVLDLLARPDPPAEAELDARFTPSFLAAVPAASLVDSLAPVAGDYEVVEDDGGEIDRSGVVQRDDGLRLSFQLVIDPGDGGRMSGLRFQPATPEIDGPITPAVVEEALAEVAPQAGYGLYEVVDGRCEVLEAADPEGPLAVGSVFKLWVLAAVAEAAVAGDLAWDDEVTVTADLRSTPDGEVQRLADGDRITVAELAVHMISISDNTATDLLLDHVGRRRVEEAMVRAGVAEPERNIPFPTTREIFLLKLDPTHAGYVDLDAEGRRAYLDTTLAGLPLTGPGGLSEDALPPGPWQIETLEWFASPLDGCRTMARLSELAADPVNQPHLDAAMSTNPGMDADPARWSTVWFKGGSEPGVLATTWYLVDADGRAFVATGALNDPDNDFGEVAGMTPLQALIPLLELRLGR